MKHQARKRFGQHFLNDAGIIDADGNERPQFQPGGFGGFAGAVFLPMGSSKIPLGSTPICRICSATMKR